MLEYKCNIYCSIRCEYVFFFVQSFNEEIKTLTHIHKKCRRCTKCTHTFRCVHAFYILSAISPHTFPHTHTFQTITITPIILEFLYVSFKNEFIATQTAFSLSLKFVFVFVDHSKNNKQ